MRFGLQGKLILDLEEIIFQTRCLHQVDKEGKNMENFLYINVEYTTLEEIMFLCWNRMPSFMLLIIE